MGTWLVVIAEATAVGPASGTGAAFVGAGADAAASSFADASVSTLAITVPTGTVSCSWTTIAARTPPTGDGISESTLSVLISRIVSSFAIFSPTFFAQRRIFPSWMLSPILGMTTSTSMQVRPC